MYRTNNPKVAKIAQHAGVDEIFVDMEYIGKSLRQGGMNTVQNFHTIDDIKNIRNAIDKKSNTELLVRVNPIHDESESYTSSEEEINQAIEAGADTIMLPYFKTIKEVKRFLNIVDNRVKTCLLLETPEAAECVDELLELDGIDEIHIGLNDLSLGYKKKFMFELLCDGTVENLCKKIKEKNIPYGFGGIARIGKGILPSELIIKEHYRLGSTAAILSRSFCDANQIDDLSIIEDLFLHGVKDIRDEEMKCLDCNDYMDNLSEISKRIDLYLNSK